MAAQAHAGMRHQDGVSAVLETARQIAKIEALTDYETGVTANVGLWTGGSGANVRPALAEIEVDIRLPDDVSAEATCAVMDSLSPVDPEVRLEIEGGLNRPPYPKTDAIAELHMNAQEALALDIGMESLDDTATGGFSDGNFTAALGIPTLDGLGVDGDGAHTEEERPPHRLHQTAHAVNYPAVGDAGVGAFQANPPYIIPGPNTKSPLESSASVTPINVKKLPPGPNVI